MKTYLNAILAGIFIGIAGTVFLATPQVLAGAFLFGFGLLTILCYQFKLFTGAVGYWVNQKGNYFGYFLELVRIWLGNLTGTALVGLLVRSSRIYNPVFATRIEQICAAKLADNIFSMLILAFFCGILMYVAVETFRRKDELHAVVRIPVVFLCVAVFILCGFEHSIAGMYYFAVSGNWNCGALLAVALMTLGNSLGGMMIPAADKIRR